MTHPIIKTDNYLLVVDESEIKDDVWHLDNGVIKKWKGNLHSNRLTSKKIIYHLPLNNAPILEGVPLLPPLEDEVDSWITNTIGNLKDEHTKKTAAISLKGGYNKAKEEYKYTEEDLAKLFYVGVQLGINQELAVSSNKSLQDEDAVLKKCIKSLQQPKYPVAFECEMVTPYTDGYADDRVRRFYGVPEAKTITNSQGLTQVVGKYIY
jgi:hypothetical protein